MSTCEVIEKGAAPRESVAVCEHGWGVVYTCAERGRNASVQYLGGDGMGLARVELLTFQSVRGGQTLYHDLRASGTVVVNEADLICVRWCQLGEAPEWFQRAKPSRISLAAG